MRTNPWRIRNRKPASQYPPELVERMVAEMRLLADDHAVSIRDYSEKARAILADLPQPVDADLELARKAWEDASHAFHYGKKQDAIDAILAAIKRVRAEKG